MQAQTVVEGVRKWVSRKQAVRSCEELVQVAREAGDRGVAGALYCLELLFWLRRLDEENYVLCITLTCFVYALCHFRQKEHRVATRFG